jgi:hypothetical protein
MTARFYHCTFEIVWYNKLRNSLNESKELDMRLDPGAKVFARASQRKYVIARAKDGYKNMCSCHFSGFTISNPNRLASEVDECPLPSRMILRSLVAYKTADS